MTDKLTEWNALALRLIEDPVFTQEDFERLRELTRECREELAKR